MTILVATIFAILNRARGSQFWTHLPSTVLSRLLATGLMALLVTAETGEVWALVTWPLLMLWCTPAWDLYWSAAIGNPTDITKPAFAPVDWIMKHLPAMPLRLWGTVAMGLRQALAIPAIAVVAVLCGHPLHACYGLFTLLFGLVYMAAGFGPNRYAIPIAEYATGGFLGLLFFATIH